MLTKILLLLDIVSEFLAALWLKKKPLERFKTPQCLRCLDACKRVYSLPFWRNATCSLLFKNGNPISKERKMRDLESPKFLEKKELNSLKSEYN